MTCSMILIDETNIEGIDVKFYNGIDFDVVVNHPNDGSNGFIYFFIDNWVEEIKKHRRNNKIDSIIENSKIFDPEDIENNYIAVYQTSGYTSEVYKTIREKVERKILTNFPWLPIAGITKCKT